MAPEELIIGVIAEGDPEYDVFIIEVEVEDEEPRDGDHFVRVKVFSPRDPDGKWFRFRKDQTVGSAAQVAATEFGYEGGSPTFETKKKVVLDRSLTLKDAGVHNREVLELVDAGTGV
jgi:hypothetical protein